MLVESKWDDEPDGPAGFPEEWEPNPDDPPERPDYEPDEEDLRVMALQRLSDVTDVFGANVRAARKARLWSQTDLAQQLAHVGVYVHQTTVAKVENGTRPTSVAEVWALASVLGLGYDELLAPVAAQSDRLLRAQHELDRAQRRRASLQADLDRQEAEVQAAAEVLELLRKERR